MSFTFNGIPGAEVTISGGVDTLPSIPTGATAIKAGMQCSFAGAESQTIYTPTAGKSLYIQTITLSSDNDAFFGVGDNISAPSNDTLRSGYIAAIRSKTGGAHLSVTYPIPVKIATALNAYSGAAGTLQVAYTGYEV